MLDVLLFNLLMTINYLQPLFQSSSSSSEEENSSYEGEENSITYDSESGGSDKSINSAPTLRRKPETTAAEN